MRRKNNKLMIYPVAFFILAAGSFIYKRICIGMTDDVAIISRETESEDNSEISAETTSDNRQEELQVIVSVYICGAVDNPGVYEIMRGDILNSVVEAAGGLSEDADRNNINLVFVISENMTIYIPQIGETDYPQGEYLLRYSANGVSDDSQVIFNSNSEGGGDSNHRININTATEEELITLPGIGPALAALIVEYRVQNGYFNSVEELTSVAGIGEAKLERIIDRICI